MKSAPINIGFTLIGDGNWRGGLNYQSTLLKLISGPLSSELEATVLVSENQKSIAYDNFGHFSKVEIVVDRRAEGAGNGNRAVKAMILGTDREFSNLVSENNIDLVFENARYFGRSFAKPIVSWVPDFQHRVLPHLFSQRARLKRNIGFQAQCYGRRRILLSSHSAQHDCEIFYPRSKGRTNVARFCSEIDLAKVHNRIESLRAEYSLPEQYFYLPNHFWPHKNHRLVLDSLLVIKQQGLLDKLPLIIMSGPTSDGSSTALFDQFIKDASDAGLSHWLRHIGLVPYLDVLALNSAATAVLNPSRFEGWSSTVEEAKSLGSRLVISDIPVHREQAPESDFFALDDSDALANLLLDIPNLSPSIKCRTNELIAKNNARLTTFSNAFLECVQSASKI